jgi:ribosomal protein L15E
LLKNPHVQIGADTQRLFASLIRNQLSEDRIIEWAEQISAVRALGPALDGARTADNVLGLLWG